MKQYKDEWIRLSDVQEVYEDISPDTVSTLAYNFKKDGKDTGWYKSIKGVDGSFIFINVGYFKYVWEKRRRIQFAGQDMYWKLIEIYKNDWSIAKKFAQYCNTTPNSANMFLHNTLFSNTYHMSLTNMVIAKMYINFYNFCLTELEPFAFDTLDEECDYYEAKRILYKTQRKNNE